MEQEERIESLESLLAALDAGARPVYLFFWGHHPKREGDVDKSCLSQWWPVQFQMDGIVYPSAEHYMMAEKARLFGDESTRQRILTAASPGEAKSLGRQVAGFDEARWAAERVALVVRGNRAKFGQNPALAAWLRSTAPRILVEASPQDRVWGIGLAASHPDAENPRRWQGNNLLGFALMQVRREMIAKE